MCITTARLVYFMFLSVLSACIYVYHVGSSEGGIGSPGTGIRDGRELSITRMLAAEPRSSGGGEEEVIITAKPSLVPTANIFNKCCTENSLGGGLLCVNCQRRSSEEEEHSRGNEQ